MTDKIESQFELLSLPEKESLLLKEGKLLSRREADGLAIFIYALKEANAEICYYLRSHEIVGATIHLSAKTEI